MPAPEEFDTIVLGGGIMGCSLAYHLAHDHHASVLLVERATLASGASGKAGGLLSAQCWNDWDVEAVEESRREYRELCRQEPGGLYEETGGVRSVSSASSLPGLEAAHQRLVRHKIPGELLDVRALQEKFPQGKFDGVVKALYTPTDAIVLPADLTQLYGRLAAESGAALHYGTTLPVLERTGSRWSVQAGERSWRTARLVVACGAWSKKVLGTVGLSAPLSPYPTRACLLKVGERRPFPYYHDNDLDVYLRPFPGGDILVGDGTELREVDPDRLDTTGDLPFLENIASFLERRFPAWSGAALGAAWTGVVTSTPDRRPLIGPYPGVEGLYLAAGFNGFGLMRGGSAGKRLALGLVRDDWKGLAPCDPRRFPPPHAPFVPKPGFTLESEVD